MQYSKHNRQHCREPRNMSKSVRLDVKKTANRKIKEIEKEKSLDPRQKLFRQSFWFNVLKDYK